MKNILLLILGVFLVSFTGTLVKLSLDTVKISVIAMYRLGLGGGILFLFALWNPQLYKLKFKELKIFFIAGLVFSVHYLTYFKALTLTSVTSTTLIICTQPFVALAFGYMLYKEKISKLQFLTLCFALIGVGIVAGGDIGLGIDAIIGDLLILIAVIMYVIYLLIGKQVIKKYSFIIYTSILFLTAGLILFLYNLMYGYEMIHLSSRNWIILILLALIPNAGQVIFIYVLRFVKSSLVATAILLEPFIATVIAMLILGDSVLFTQVFGGLLIITSVFVYIRLERNQSNSEDTQSTEKI